ncbi:DUF3742 family protein [Caballeronia mineralivorans]|uniref:DUF3742 family protein n=1 Tax=Caballeronia mineralivorans TaxID=2010198 RepID=UPI00094FA84E
MGRPGRGAGRTAVVRALGSEGKRLSSRARPPSWSDQSHILWFIKLTVLTLLLYAATWLAVLVVLSVAVAWLAGNMEAA